MQDYTKLKVWQKAHEFTLKLYKLTSSFPKEENCGLISQIRRAAISVLSNISEGCGRFGNEVKYQLVLSKDLGYISINDYNCMDEEITQIRKMLATYIKRITESK